MKKVICTITLAAVIANTGVAQVGAVMLENLKVSSQSTDNSVSGVGVTKFDLYNNANFEAYSSIFEVKPSKYENNGGQYSSSSLNKAFDGVLSTHWETGKANNSSFTNNVTVTFDEVVELNRIAYAVRQDNGYKGYANKVKIYASLTESGEDFTLVAEGSSSTDRALMEFKFDTTEFKRLRFEFVEAHSSWASAAELMFFKEDVLLDTVNDLFTDSNKTELKEEYNSRIIINELINEVATHPLKEQLLEELMIAEGIVNGKPEINGVEEVKLVELRSSFTLLDGITANDKEDGDITSGIVIEDGGFNINKAGTYEVKYIATDSDGNSITESSKVIVYSKKEYVSDLKYTINTSGWGGIKNDKSPSGATISIHVDGEETTFEKGIGAHAASEITFNIEGKNYEYFNALLGIDIYNRGNVNSSVIYKVLVDGEEVFVSDVIKENTNAQNILIPVSGASEVKLITDIANENDWGDQSVWADATFITTNSKPVINGIENTEVALNGEFDILAGVTAIDVEDGDLTSSVVVDDGGFDTSKAGRYVVTYTVTDSDLNITTKTRNIDVHTNATVHKFNYINNSNFGEYVSEYGISPSAISNNGGNSNSYVLSNAIDGNINTLWETGRDNSSSFTNEVIFTFDKIETISRIVYATRQDGHKKLGFPLKFSIYGTTSDEGDDFTLISTGAYESATGDFVEIDFTSTEFKRLKFVFDEAHSNRPTASEFMFFKEDSVIHTVGNLFADGTMSELNSIYNSKEIIDELVENATNHPFINEFSNAIKIAEEIIKDENKYVSTVIELSQRGDRGKEQSRTKTSYSMFADDTTGHYVTPGETIKIYVDANEGDVMPRLVFGQIADDKNGWRRSYTLKPGYNEIVAPSFDTMMPAAIYFENPALKGDQAYAPRVRFEGGTKYPMYVHGETSQEEFKAELQKYLNNVSYNDNDFANGNPNGYYYNITEFVSENNIISTSAAGALVAVQNGEKQGITVSEYMDVWEEFYDMFAEYSGYDLEDETSVNYRPRGKFNSRVFTKGPSGWADGGYTGYNGGNSPKRNEEAFVSILADPYNAGWLTAHEWGHIFDNSSIATHESTNNLYSLRQQDLRGVTNRMITDNRWENHFTNYHNTKVYPNDQLFYGTITYQLEALYGDNIYGQAQLYARENKDNWMSGLNNQQRLAVSISWAIGKDVLAHYEYFGIQMNDRARELVSHLPKEAKKTYYVNNKNYEDGAKAFENSDVTPIISSVKLNSNENVELKFEIDEDDMAVLVYEVYRDEEYLGVTYNNTFVDKTAKAETSYNYSVIAYDRELNASNESEVFNKHTAEPTIATKEKVTLKLNEEFIPMNYVVGRSYKDEIITTNITVKSNNVDNTTKGVYEVVYELEDKGAITTKTMDVVVVSDYAYLSDIKESSAKVGWGSFRKDKSPNNTTIELSRDGIAAAYEKGLGVHADSQVVYEIESGKYEVFEASIGINQDMRGKVSSAKFIVELDGEVVYTSKEFKSTTDEVFVSIPLNGASTITLKTDSLGDNAADHTVWAEAKLVTSNSKPTMEVEKSITTKVGEPIELDVVYSAKDVEDGDLTGNVIIEGIDEVNFDKAGKYSITYSVTDSDDNTTVVVRNINVVNVEDYHYLTEYTWTSANQSYGTAQKDISTSGNALRLTGEDNKVVTYERGLGLHSTSTIVYNLASLDKEYAMFTAFVGVDRQMYGSVGTVQFEVYVDGELKFDSGVMTSQQQQKYVEVDLSDAKELKLVVKDGGNGNGSDHATWGDTKLHFVGETIETPEMPEIPEATETVIIFEDSKLEYAVKYALGLTQKEKLTNFDMKELTNLGIISKGITSLEGLQYAINLKELNINGNDVSDLSPLTGLHKLEKLNIVNNNVSDLIPIGYLESLNTLWLAGNKLEDLRTIGSLNLTQIGAKEQVVETDEEETLSGETLYIELPKVYSRNSKELIPNSINIINATGEKVKIDIMIEEGKIIMPAEFIKVGNLKIELEYNNPGDNYTLNKILNYIVK